jgi:hypothetical protein
VVQCYIVVLIIWLEQNTEVPYMVLSITTALAVLTMEIGFLTLIFAAQQIRYMAKRDNEADKRQGWIDLHKYMQTFIFYRNLTHMRLTSTGEFRMDTTKDMLEAFYNVIGAARIVCVYIR